MEETWFRLMCRPRMSDSQSKECLILNPKNVCFLIQRRIGWHPDRRAIVYDDIMKICNYSVQVEAFTAETVRK